MSGTTAPPSVDRGPRLPWQAIVAATVLALVAAGLVLVFASNRDSGDGTASDAASDTASGSEAIDLRPSDEVASGDPLDIEFTFVDGVDGTSGTLRDLTGDTPLVVNFFGSWCPPCVAEMPDFEAVSQALGDQVRFVGIAVNDRPADAARIVEQTGVSYTWARDNSGDISGAAGVFSMPSTMFLDADGEIVEFKAGPVDADELRDLIDENLGVSA